MRKFASLAALALCAGTAVAAGATTASAAINLGDDPAGTATAPAPGTLDFAHNWCGAPWLWTSQPTAACDTAHNDAAAGQ